MKVIGQPGRHNFQVVHLHMCAVNTTIPYYLSGALSTVQPNCKDFQVHMYAMYTMTPYVLPVGVTGQPKCKDFQVHMYAMYTMTPYYLSG